MVIGSQYCCLKKEKEMKKMASFVSDELLYKNKYLHTALIQANNIIATLEQENLRLRDVLANLASKNNEDLSSLLKVNNDQLCEV